MPLKKADDKSKQAPEEGDDKSRSTSGEDQRSEKPDDHDGYSGEVLEPSRLHPADDVVCEVKRKEEDREQRRDG